MLNFEFAVRSLVFLVLAMAGLQCVNPAARYLVDQCEIGRVLEYESIEGVLLSAANLFAVYEGNVVYVGNSISLFSEFDIEEDSTLCSVLPYDGNVRRECRLHIVMSSEKQVTGSLARLDGSAVDKAERFLSVLVVAIVRGEYNRYALVSLTCFNDIWRVEKDAIRFYDHPPNPQDVDAFLLEHDTPDYQLIPRASIPGAPNAELYDSHIEFHSIRICQDACEDAFGGVPSSLAKHL